MYKVSIIVPVHNSADFLEQSVSSVRKQTLSEIEIILVENASTDNSLDICNKIASSDERVKVVHLDVGDLSTARNEGVKVASADYVGFMDSDDIIDPEMYETMYMTAIQNGLDVVNCNYVKHYPVRADKYQYCEDGRTDIISPAEMIRLNLLEKIPQSACTMLLKKTIVENCPFPAFKYFEDRATTFRFIAAAKACAQIYRSYYHYYQYRGNICLSKSFKRNHDFAEADTKRLEFIKESGMFHDDDKPVIAAKSAESLLRKINRMRKSVRTDGERMAMRAIMEKVTMIPEGTRLSLKARIILFFVKKKIA